MADSFPKNMNRILVVTLSMFVSNCDQNQYYSVVNTFQLKWAYSIIFQQKRKYIIIAYMLSILKHFLSVLILILLTLRKSTYLDFHVKHFPNSSLYTYIRK